MTTSKSTAIQCSQCDDTGWRPVERNGVRVVIACNHRQAPGAQPKSPAEWWNAPPGEFMSARVAQLDRVPREIGMLILNHRGKEQAISIREVIAFFAAKIPLSERDVKAAVETVRTVARVPIAASKEPPYGYFIPTRAEEHDEMYSRHLREAVKHILIARLHRPQADIVEELRGQLQLLPTESHRGEEG